MQCRKMNITATKFDLKQIKSDLLTGIHECTQRGLLHSTKWLAELNYCLSHVHLDEYAQPSYDFNELDTYLMAKTFFDAKEYDRCAYFTQHSTSSKSRFIYLYAKYLGGEKKKIDSMTESNCPPDPMKNKTLKPLLTTLQADYSAKQLDGWGLYLYGIVLKKFDLIPQAIDVLLEAVHAMPIHWGAWLELSPLIPDREKLVNISLPDHWLKYFFLAHSYLEQLCNDEALQIYNGLLVHFKKFNYIHAQIAIAHHNKRELDKAIDVFRYMQEEDPCRLDNLDTYSNLLYVKDLKTDLANLAHHTVLIDKYRVETCCVVGNYYSLRSDHQKAVLYFQRALRLNPLYLSAWTLMGHEYMEMKNTNAAIQSYRHAIEVNKRDFRAWYGLGQTYEILKMPFYSLHYYKQAQQLRPSDSRMLIALGETYERLEKNKNALQCYHKACNVGDIEGLALLKLAKLYELHEDIDNAASAYTEYCLSNPKQSPYSNDQSDLYSAYRYLANFHLNKGALDHAYSYAYKCVEYESTKEEGKHILKMIQEQRKEEQQEMTDVTMDETGISIESPSANVSQPEDVEFSPKD